MDLATSLATMNQTTQNLVNAYSAIEASKNAEKNYNLQKENYDYQKSIQQQIFEREDTAVQRRMADLEASGLNKNLAAGSSAGTGSVVSTSVPQKDSSWLNKLKFNLDYISAVEDIKQKKLQTQIMKENQYRAAEDATASKYYKEMAMYTYNEMERQDDLRRILYRYQNGSITDDEVQMYSGFLKPYINEVLNSDNQAEMIKKQNQMWMFNNMADTIFKGINAGSSGFNSYNNYKRNEYQHQKDVYNSFMK
ncbi:minor capsid protein [Microvirus sp.]|nr:minor capsid protein [Microvirus sp.]